MTAFRILLLAARDFTRVGWRVGLPAAIAGGIVTVALLSPW